MNILCVTKTLYHSEIIKTHSQNQTKEHKKPLTILLGDSGGDEQVLLGHVVVEGRHVATQAPGDCEEIEGKVKM